MVETIYKEYVEVFNREEEVLETTKTRPLFEWLDDPFENNTPIEDVSYDNLISVTRMVSTSEEGFKEALSSKTTCSVIRETIVVEFDPDKKFIQVKKYSVNKNWRQLKKNKIFTSKSNKTYTSLKFDLTNASFTYYKSNFVNKKRIKAIVRKDVINMSTLSHIGDIFSFNLLLNRVGLEILNILTQKLLGYGYDINNKDFSKEIRGVFNHTDDKDTFIEPSIVERLRYFVTSIFLKKHGVDYNRYNMLSRASALKRDKKICLERGIVGYYCHITGIEDKNFVKEALFRGEYIKESKLKTPSTQSVFSVYDAFTQPFNIKNLSILYHMGFSLHEIIENEALSKIAFNPNNSNNNIGHSLDTIIKVVRDNKDYLKGALSVLMIGENKTVVDQIDTAIDQIERLINIKLRLKNVFNIDLELFSETPLKLVYETVAEVALITGLIKPSNAFINRIQKLVGPGVSISLHRGNLKRLNKILFPDSITIPNSVFNWGKVSSNPDPISFKLLLKSKEEKIAVNVNPNDFTYTVIQKTIKPKVKKNQDSLLLQKLNKYANKFGVQKNTLTYVGFKAVYSKDVLIKKLEEIGLNVSI